MNGIPESPMLGAALSVSHSILTGKRKNKVPYGFCQCGCGGLAPISKVNRKERNQKKGSPVRFIKNHHSKLQPKGPLSPSWKGGESIKNGCVYVYSPSNLRANKGCVKRALLVVESAIKKPLKTGAIIHHVDGNSLNDSNKNLVVCEDIKYHLDLHRRSRAYRACGNPKWFKCGHCHEYDDSKKMYQGKRSCYYHKKCKAEYDKKRARTRKRSR